MIFHDSSVNYRIIQDSIALCVNLIRRFLHSFQISKRSLVKGRSSHLKSKLFILEKYMWKLRMIYFYQNKFLNMYFSKIMQTFYDLLFTRSNSDWLHT